MICLKNSKKTLRKVITFLLLIVDPILLVITFACPFVVEHFENACSELPNGFLFAVQIVIAIILLLVSIAKAIIDAFRNKKHRKNVRSRLILSHMNLLFDLKGEMIRDSTYHPYIQNNYSPLFYNVHGYIRDVCKNLRDTVAAIIETESEYVDVALIYHYQGSDNWEWLSGKSGTSGAMSLNEFIQGPTLFNYVIKEKQIVFENDKEQCKFYLPKRRDRFFNNNC